MGKNFKFYNSISYEPDRRSLIELKMREANECIIVKRQENIGFISRVFNKIIVSILIITFLVFVYS